MNAPLTQASLGELVSDVFERASHRRAASVLGWSVAIGGHLLAVGVALAARQPSTPLPPPLEVELAAPPPAPAPAPPLPPPPPPAAAPTPPHVERAPSTAARQAVTQPEPARAGALVTAKSEPAPSADEPVDFTNDPSALGFGSGVVAVGGKAQVGAPRAAPLGTPGPPSSVSAPRSGDGLTPLSDLSQKPSLGESDPCHGYFPTSARDDVATATVMVTLAKTGAVSGVRLISESPPAQGFGGAARACMQGKRFTPGLDRDGRPAATAIRVSIRFRR
jgi:hypothetical protein